MAPRFGTSGLRGLVTELTDPLCAAYAQAFLAGTATDGAVLIGRDLRASSPRIAAAVAAGAARAGLGAVDCGVLPTPALALAAAARGTAAIMVTGSHIPDDRNGLKFYTAQGEITKADEARIAADYARLGEAAVAPAPLTPDPAPLAAYAARYTGFFALDALAGLRVGVYEHSSAAREVLGAVLSALGATPVALGRAERFVPVDTEALDPATREMLAGWAAEHRLDAIASTDGDADRPMLADAAGRVIPGDVLGPLTAAALGADTVVTPVSSNTAVELMGRFAVHRTRIGSPFVIGGMEAALAAGARGVVGYEANGGFLLGFEARDGERRLAPLMTRDSLLPILAPLAAARAAGQDIAGLAATLPPRFTASDRLQGVATEAGAALAARFGREPALTARLTEGLGTPGALDATDGARLALSGGLTVHLRPSGNAPELRVYVEAGSPERAAEVLALMLARVAAEL